MSFRNYVTRLVGLFCTVSMFASVCGPVARADEIISNFPMVNEIDGTTIASSDSSFAVSKAIGFTMPAGSAYLLTSTSLRLRKNDPWATMELALFGHSGGGPVGLPLVNFVVPAFGLGASTVVFAPSAQLVLQPETTYWLAARGSAGSELIGINWLMSSPFPGILPTGIATHAGTRHDNLSTWPPLVGGTVFNTYEIQGTPVAVPEPGSFALLGIGCSMLGLHCLRRRRKVRGARGRLTRSTTSRTI